MSEPGSVGPEKSVPATKPISPARNIIGLIVLIGVLVFGWFEYMPKRGYNAAVAALEAKTPEDSKDLLTMQEAETLIGKEADGPPVDFTEGSRELSKKTYTWNGLLRHYTLTAHYSKEKYPHLIEFKTEGADLPQQPKTLTTPPAAPATNGAGGVMRKGAPGKGGGAAKSSPSPGKGAADSKSPHTSPTDKPADTKPEPTDKTPPPKANPPADGVPKEKPAAPGNEKSTSKPVADSPTAKP
jgi:hypothetical protein